jgi:hypothetical protein
VQLIDQAADGWGIFQFTDIIDFVQAQGFNGQAVAMLAAAQAFNQANFYSFLGH